MKSFRNGSRRSTGPRFDHTPRTAYHRLTLIKIRETTVKFYNSIGPNPHVVRMFMAEKGLKIPSQDIDLMGGENRKPDHLARNPHGQMPALELDDGSFVSEILAICEYLEDINPKPALIGS